MSSTLKDGCSRTRDPDAAAVLDYWLGDCSDPENVKRRGKLWFSSTAEQDRTMRERFGGLHQRAQQGDLDHWTAGPGGALALVLLLDQFTRNLYRSTASAFANDERALAISRDCIDRGFDGLLEVVECAFLYMPFQHSESLEDQRESVRLFGRLLENSAAPFKPFAKDSYEYAMLHYEIVERFGRFPHRNELLGRRPTRDEKRYLEQGGHRFGQG